MRESQIVGCILGTAIGDAIGLPYEGVSRRRLTRLLGIPNRHRFFFGRGMVSDDTEHTCMVAQSLVASVLDVATFERELAKRLKWWFLALPAGVGKATLRSCLKLWCGFPAQRSGVFSAGNGPAMRAAIIGATFDDLDRMLVFVRSSTRITHTDPKAEFGAIAVALATHTACRNSSPGGKKFVEQLSQILGPDGRELVDLLNGVVASVAKQESTLDYATNNGHERGVTGYTNHTLPVVIHAWLTYPTDYREAIQSVVQCGGDSDTTAAILGGIIGATVGTKGIPEEWQSNLCEWPRTRAWMSKLGVQLHQTMDHGTPQSPIRLSFPATLIRNVLFLIVVLFHGFRRIFPPY